MIGGAPKCSKTWLGLDLALSVATGTACLGKYAVPQAGPVLVYLAEDALPIVRERVEGMARHRGLDLDACRDPRDHRADAAARSRSAPRAAVGDGQAAAAAAAAARSVGATSRHRRESTPPKWPELLAYFRSLQRQLDLSVDAGASHAKERRRRSRRRSGTSRLQ